MDAFGVVANVFSLGDVFIRALGAYKIHKLKAYKQQVSARQLDELLDMISILNCTDLLTNPASTPAHQAMRDAQRQIEAAQRLCGHNDLEAQSKMATDSLEAEVLYQKQIETIKALVLSLMPRSN